MRQGFGFLDEKRMLLATEIMRISRRYESLAEEMASLRRAAARALANAIERHGLDALQRYPAPAEAPMPPPIALVKFMGVPLKASPPWQIVAAPAPPSIDESAEAAACRESFERWLEATIETGVLANNLERLGREYRRVERRAKALENVLMPEVEAFLKRVVEQLDILDQEEAIRVHTVGMTR